MIWHFLGSYVPGAAGGGWGSAPMGDRAGGAPNMPDASARAPCTLCLRRGGRAFTTFPFSGPAATSVVTLSHTCNVSCGSKQRPAKWEEAEAALRGDPQAGGAEGRLESGEEGGFLGALEAGGPAGTSIPGDGWGSGACWAFSAWS